MNLQLIQNSVDSTYFFHYRGPVSKELSKNGSVNVVDFFSKQPKTYLKVIEDKANNLLSGSFNTKVK